MNADCRLLCKYDIAEDSTVGCELLRRWLTEDIFEDLARSSWWSQGLAELSESESVNDRQRKKNIIEIWKPYTEYDPYTDTM